MIQYGSCCHRRFKYGIPVHAMSTCYLMHKVETEHLPVSDLVFSLVLRVVVPGNVLQRNGPREFDRAPQVNALAPCHDHLLLRDTSVTQTRSRASHILQEAVNSKTRIQYL